MYTTEFERRRQLAVRALAELYDPNSDQDPDYFAAWNRFQGRLAKDHRLGDLKADVKAVKDHLHGRRPGCGI